MVEAPEAVRSGMPWYLVVDAHAGLRRAASRSLAQAAAGKKIVL